MTNYEENSRACHAVRGKMRKSPIKFGILLFCSLAVRQIGGRNRNRMIWRNVFRMRGCACQVPFQNQGTSKGLKKCLNAKRHSGQLAFAQTIPSHRLTTFFHPLRSSSRFLQSHMPHTSPHPERFIKTSASLPSHFPSEAQ